MQSWWMVPVLLLELELAACTDALEPGAADELGRFEAALGDPVVINEHSAGAAGWVELYNSGDVALDISGWSVDDLLGGGTAPKILAAGSVVPARGWFTVAYSGLNTASADTVHLLDRAGGLVDSHPNGWAGSSVAGLCFGRLPDGVGWAASPLPCTRGLTNRAAEDPRPPAAVLINELQSGAAGWIELYNPGEVAADLTGWSVDDLVGGGTAPRLLAAGTQVPARGLLVVAYRGFNAASADTANLLDQAGGVVDSQPNGWAGFSVAGRCFGRQPDGGPWSVASLPCTPGLSNTGGAPPPPARVVLNEFRPGAAGWVELFNAGGTPVDLSGWKVDDTAGGAAPRVIRAGTTLLPGQVLLFNYGGLNAASADLVRLLDPTDVEVDTQPNRFGVDPCYGAARCYGRLPDGGAWAPAHIPCTGGGSNPAVAPEPCLPDQPCEDGNRCTTGDTCSAACVCAAGPLLTCDDRNPCTTDACQPEIGCTNPAVPDGLASDDGLQCVGGVCGGEVPAPCAAQGGTYKSVAFTRDEECQAVRFLNHARYSQMNAITTTARDLAYDCSPANTCGYRAAAWRTVAEYAAATGGTTTLSVGTSSLLALRTASSTYLDDGRWYDTVAATWADRAALNNLWVHFERVVAESQSGLCLLVRDAPGAPNFLSACLDPWFCGPEGCQPEVLRQYVGPPLSLRGRLTLDNGSWKIVIKKIRAAHPAVR